VISWKLNVREGSVSTSVLAFNYKEKKINILDTQVTKILQKTPLGLNCCLIVLSWSLMLPWVEEQTESPYVE
jgi:hypothetical protein